MEQFLLSLPHLKHLELKGTLYQHMSNEYEWELLTDSLITFNFKFNILHFDIERTLDSFRTPFWLKEKR